MGAVGRRYRYRITKCAWLVAVGVEFCCLCCRGLVCWLGGGGKYLLLIGL